MQQEIPVPGAVGKQRGRGKKAGQDEQNTAPAPAHAVALLFHPALAENTITDNAGQELGQAQQRAALQQAGIGHTVLMVPNGPNRRQQVKPPQQEEPQHFSARRQQTRCALREKQIKEKQGGKRPQRGVEGEKVGVPGL